MNTINERIESLENISMGNFLAFAGHSGLSRIGREIGELFLAEYANNTPGEIIDAYKIINDRIWDTSQTAGDGFGRAVGQFIADKFSEETSEYNQVSNI